MCFGSDHPEKINKNCFVLLVQMEALAVSKYAPTQIVFEAMRLNRRSIPRVDLDVAARDFVAYIRKKQDRIPNLNPPSWMLRTTNPDETERTIDD